MFSPSSFTAGAFTTIPVCLSRSISTSWPLSPKARSTTAISEAATDRAAPPIQPTTHNPHPPTQSLCSPDESPFTALPSAAPTPCKPPSARWLATCKPSKPQPAGRRLRSPGRPPRRRSRLRHNLPYRPSQARGRPTRLRQRYRPSRLQRPRLRLNSRPHGQARSALPPRPWLRGRGRKSRVTWVRLASAAAPRRRRFRRFCTGWREPGSNSCGPRRRCRLRQRPRRGRSRKLRSWRGCPGRGA
jgi:hypothetical protein